MQLHEVIWKDRFIDKIASKHGVSTDDKQKHIDPLPEEFASYEEAAEFWATHDSTDYLDSFETVAVEAELKRRRYEVEIDEELMKSLTEQAQKRGIGVNQLVSEMLKEKIRPAA